MKTKSKVLLSAFLVIALCVSLIAGTTLALFSSEDKVNIAVTSGKVNVEATIGKPTASVISGSSVTSANVQAVREGKSVSLNGMTPGDQVDFDILVKNNSTVGVKYRVKILCEEGEKLMSGLKITIGGKQLDNVKSYVSAYQPLQDKAELNVHVTIALPERGNDVDNRYQDLSAKISYAVEAVQSNGIADNGTEQVESLYVVYNTAEAQQALDNAEDNTTIYLAAGEYDKLFIRTSDKSVALEEYKDNYDTSSAHKYPVYNRIINGLTIKGEQGTVVNGIKVPHSNEDYYTAYLNSNKNEVKVPNTEDSYKRFYQMYTLSNLTFEDLTLKDGIDLRLYEVNSIIKQIYSDYNQDTYIKKVTVRNVTTTADDSHMPQTSDGRNRLLTAKNIDNVLVENCVINNRYNGTYFEFTNNITVRNNTYHHLEHNAFSTGRGCAGNIVFENNTVLGSNNRVFRMNQGDVSLVNASSIAESWNVVIKNNVFVNCGDPEDIAKNKGILMKVTGGSQYYNVPANFTIEGNYWDGLTESSQIFGDEGFADSAPKSEAVYEISNANELRIFAQLVNSNKLGGVSKAVLTNDIDLEGKEWTPIGTSSNCYFKGTFDGQGHTVSNLTITSSLGEEGGQNLGLFGYIAGSTVIKNLKIDTVNIVGYMRVGAVAGNAYTGTIEGVSVKNVTINANRQAGGITGYSYGTIRNCYAENVKITAIPNKTVIKGEEAYDNGDKVGGIVGYAASTYLINNEVKNVTLTAWRDLGGVAGYCGSDGGSNISGNKADTVNLSYYIIENVTEIGNPADPDAHGSMGAVAGRINGAVYEEETNVATNVTKNENIQ